MKPLGKRDLVVLMPLGGDPSLKAAFACSALIVNHCDEVSEKLTSCEMFL